MYTSKQVSGGRHVVSICNHQEIAAALMTFCREKNITSGVINGLGAINQLTLRFFDPTTKQFVDKKYHEQMEIANLTGNISTKDGEIYLHLHVTVGRNDYSAIAGHLLSATVSGAGEFVVEDYGAVVERTFDPEIGLNVYALDDTMPCKKQ